MGALRKLTDFLGSFGLACLLLINLFLLTLFGTLYQVEGGLFEAQKRYFESWYVVGSSPVPHVLLGGLPTMGILAINLAVGGFVRLARALRTAPATGRKVSLAGVLVVHLGIALLLASAFVKLYHSHDGHLSLAEGQSSSEFRSYYLWEVAIWDAAQEGEVEELLIPHEQISDLVDGRTRTFTSPDLPFELELSGFLRNCEALPKGPMWEGDSPTVDGYALKRVPDELEAEANIAGLTAVLREPGTENTRTEILWGRDSHPMLAPPWAASFEAGGRTWALKLRHTRYEMPFRIQLEDFRKDDHPGMAMARSFESDVLKFENGSEQRVRIQMNEPLRHGGLVLFQSSWGPQGGTERDRLYSVFSVVRNPSDHWPTWACWVIGIGMLIAFTPKLLRFVASQNKAQAAASHS